MKRKAISLMLATGMLCAVLSGCGASDEETSSVPLAVDVTQGDVTYYSEAVREVGLVPEMTLKLAGQNFGKVVLNGSKFNFGEMESIEDFFKAANVTIDPEDVFGYECDDFKFYGFSLNTSDVVMYGEFTKNGELVTKWNEAESKDYELQAIYTSSEILKDNNSYINFAVHIMCGLSEEEILTTDGNGYTSKHDNNMVYYPDERGNIISLNYITKIDTTNATEDASKVFLLETDSDKSPERYLNEIFFFKAP